MDLGSAMCHKSIEARGHDPGVSAKCGRGTKTAPFSEPVQKPELQLDDSRPAIQEVAKAAASRKIPEKIKAGAVSHEGELGDVAVVIDEAPITLETGLRYFGHSADKAVKVLVKHCEVSIKSVMGQDVLFASPAQQHPPCYPIVTIEICALNCIVKALQVSDEAFP